MISVFETIGPLRIEMPARMFDRQRRQWHLDPENKMKTEVQN